jgi:hypothetical protein
MLPAVAATEGDDTTLAQRPSASDYFHSLLGHRLHALFHADPCIGAGWQGGGPHVTAGSPVMTGGGGASPSSRTWSH